MKSKAKVLAFAALGTELWPLKRLKPYPKNARTHSLAEIIEAREAIEEFGWTYPILADETDEILAGHKRYAAAQLVDPERGWKKIDPVPVIPKLDLTADQKKAYRLWDNKTALAGGWDEGLLRAELGELQAASFDLGFTGFSLSELNVFSGPSAPDSEPEAPKVKLSDRFFAVPFSIMNAREGWWQDRKRAWLNLGIRSEVGRGENLLKMSDTVIEPDPKKRAARRAAKEAKAHAEG